MDSLISRFLSFDKLMGTSLIKIIYFLGLVGIGLMFLLSIFSALRAFGSSFGAGLGGLVLAPIIAVVSILFWRFACELYILLFLLREDVRDIRDHKLAKPPAMPET